MASNEANKNRLSHHGYGLEDDDDSQSNASYASNEDDEPILTATITFDVTVDPNGQVISTSEGQIISESLQNSNGNTISLASQQNNPSRILQKNQRSNIAADSLSSLMSASNNQKETTGFADSLDEDSDDDSTSTTTESLIERSKKYMNQEAGIIVLKRDDSKNYNINLDYDLKNGKIPSQVVKSTEPGKSFNINLDFDIHSQKEEAVRVADGGFNINLDFDIQDANINDGRNSGKTGVGIDLMIVNNKSDSSEYDSNRSGSQIDNFYGESTKYRKSSENGRNVEKVVSKIEDDLNKRKNSIGKLKNAIKFLNKLIKIYYFRHSRFKPQQS